MFVRALFCYASPVSAVGFALGTYICFALLVCSALPIVMVLWLLLTSCSSLLLRLLPSARPHGISRPSFLVYPLDLRTRVTVAFRVFDVSSHLARRVRLHIQFLSVGPRFRYCFFSPAPHDANLANRYGGSSATTPLVDFHHRCMTCPSYQKRDIRKFRMSLFLFCCQRQKPAFTGQGFRQKHLLQVRPD